MHIVVDGSSLQTQNLDVSSSANKRLDDTEFILNSILAEFVESDAETLMFSPRTEPNSRAVYNKLIYCDSNSLKEYTSKYEDIDCIVHCGYHRQYDVPFNAKLNIDLSLGFCQYSPDYIAKIDYVMYFTEYQAKFLKMTGITEDKLIKLSYPIPEDVDLVNTEHYDIIFPGMAHNGIHHFVNILSYAKYKGLSIGIPASTKQWVETFRFDNYWQGENVAKYLSALKRVECPTFKFYDDSSNSSVFYAIQNSDTILYSYESQAPSEFASVACLYAASIGKKLVVSPNDCLKEVFDKKRNCKVINSCKNYSEFSKNINTSVVDMNAVNEFEKGVNETAWELYSLIRDNINA